MRRKRNNNITKTDDYKINERRSKKRPVIILSNDDYNSKTDDIIVAAITSNILSKEYSILITSNDLVEGDLKVDSCIRADKIYTLSKNIVIRKFGKVNSDIMHDIKNKVKELIDN